MISDEHVAYDSAVTEAGKSVKHKLQGGQANSAKSGGPWGAKRMSSDEKRYTRVMMKLKMSSEYHGNRQGFLSRVTEATFGAAAGRR